MTDDTAEAGSDGRRRYRGTFEGYDPFATGDELTLHLDLQLIVCEGGDRHVALFAASPQPQKSPIWRQLAERVEAFQCEI